MDNLLRTVAYIPLDDRPCNLDRVIMAGEAMGVKVLVPDISFFKTTLDGQPKNITGLQTGSPYDILLWLRQIKETENITGYIVSLDQLNSGGLVGSRVESPYGTDITREMSRVQELVSIAGGKPIYFFDTVMRLASTVEFNGQGLYEYSGLRAYASIPRLRLGANLDDSTEELAFNNLTGHYYVNSSGLEIDYVTDLYDNGQYYQLTYEQVRSYLVARTRKLKLSREIIKYLKGIPNAYVTVGVDDGKNPDTIQKSEVEFLEKFITGTGSIFAGADELGMCMLSRFAVQQFSPWGQGRLPKIKVSYFGGGENQQADGYDYRTLDFGVNKHIEISGGTRVTTGQDIDLLVLTQPVNGKTTAQNANDMHYEINVNNTANKPMIVVDASLQQGELQKRMFGLNSVKMNTSKLLAYSSWNTVGNMLGLALGHGIGRFVFMTLGDKGLATTEALTGQVKSLFTELVKDVSYKLGAKGDIDSDLIAFTGNSKFPTNFTRYGIVGSDNEVAYSTFYRMTTGNFSVHSIAKVLRTDGTNDVYKTFASPSNCVISKVNWINYPYEDGTSSWYPLVYPWSRGFEATFPLNVSFK